MKDQTWYVAGSRGDIRKVQFKNHIWSCDCHAWRFQSEPIEQRTCKHVEKIKAELGIKAAAKKSRSVKEKVERKTRTATRKRAAKGWPANFNAMKYHQDLDDKLEPIGWFISEKKDGIWSRWFQGELWSKNKMLIETSDAFKQTMPPDFILEGEWMRNEQKMYVFDGYRDREQAMQMPFKDRLEQLKQLQKQYGFYLLPHRVVKSASDWKQLKQKAYKNLAQEGWVLKDPNSVVEFGKRSWGTMKMKPWRPTTGKLIRWVKTKSGESAELEIDVNNKIWTMKLHAVRMKKSDYPIGSQVPIRWNGMTEEGKPEFIKFDG